jgi:UrcA family protein
MYIKNTTGTQTTRMAVALLALASTALLTGVAQAAEPSGVLPKTTVSYTHLNPNSIEGAKVLYTGIKAAADDVCGKVDVRDLQGMSVTKGCRDKAISNAVASVHSPVLTKLYLDETGKSTPAAPALAQVR